MTDLIVEEVRRARAEIAAEFGYDLAKYHDWLQAQQILRKQNRQQQPSLNKTPETTGGAAVSPVSGKRRVGVPRVSP